MDKRDRFSPPGMELQAERSYFFIVLIGNICFSFLSFFGRLGMLLEYARYPFEGASYWSFPQAIGNSLKGFPIFAVSMVAFVVMRYLYFFEGSRSIYTMKRVKSPWELHIRCWMLPVLGAGALMVCKCLCTVVCFLIFLLLTPDAVDAPGWEQLIGGLLL